MNKEETLKILSVMKLNYPSFGAKSDDMKVLLDLWHTCLGEYDYNLVSRAMYELIKNRVEGYPPTIGEINRLVKRMTGETELTEVELWNCTIKAIKNGYYNSKEEFDKLPIPCKKWLGRSEQLRDYSLCALDTLNTVVKSNFLKTIGNIRDREEVCEKEQKMALNGNRGKELQEHIKKLLN